MIKQVCIISMNLATCPKDPFGKSYDHFIRDAEELERTIWYVLNNPVKAQLVESWEQWQWSYCKFFGRNANPTYNV